MLAGFRYDFLLLRKKLFLVAPLHDVGENEDSDDEIEGGFGHLVDFVPEEFQVGKVSTFRQEHDPNNKKNEEAEDLIHAVFLKKSGNPIGEPNH